MLSIEELATFCKRKGFVYSSSELYGGLSGFFDYGPLGVEVTNRIKESWWQTFVRERPDVVGLDGAIVNHRKIWEASGHAEGFNDVFVECTKCNSRVRADHYVEERLDIKAEGLSAKDLNKLIKDNKLMCPECGGAFSTAAAFNLMFKTHVGPVAKDDAVAYLRPETAQLIFTNFKNVLDTTRVKLPFGIAQIGKAYRNEISPRDFLFRVREFEQMELEFFTHPQKVNDCPFMDEVNGLTVQLIDAETQEKEKDEPRTITIKEMVSGKLLKKWQAYWLAKQYQWFLDLGINPDHLRVREHMKDELAHYATACFDIEYKFPFGWKEIYGNAARGTFDLEQHQNHSKQSLEVFDEESKEKFLPVVAAEPSQGVGRAFLAFMFDAYHNDKERGNVVLKLHPSLAPVHVAVFPLVRNKEPVVAKARDVFDSLKRVYAAQYDESGSVGKRYARSDEVGIPLCITVDFDSVDNDTVTIRDRDSTAQILVEVSALKDVLSRFMAGEEFNSLGKKVEK